MNARLAPDAIELLATSTWAWRWIPSAACWCRWCATPTRRACDSFGREFRELVERARTGRSLPDDLSGGTFTITNLGMYDVDAFTPVINLPEAAILGVGRIAPKPVARGDQVVIRQMWNLCLAFDHRLSDGAPAARFLQAYQAADRGALFAHRPVGPGLSPAALACYSASAQLPYCHAKCA